MRYRAPVSNFYLPRDAVEDPKNEIQLLKSASAARGYKNGTSDGQLFMFDQQIVPENLSLSPKVLTLVTYFQTCETKLVYTKALIGVRAALKVVMKLHFSNLWSPATTKCSLRSKQQQNC